MKLETRIRKAFANRYDVKATIREGVVTAKGFLPTRIEEWKTERTESGGVVLKCFDNVVFKFHK